ncbi:glycosyltransferase family 2 protein [Pseudoalteromonas sp. MEBiC 03607]|uniref:glycosyltransferase family 2 protein n=1 Tax=unclassified Pseudoalteromonas TaxID=194690 RepID=UPI0010938EA1|nr:MULTISPECIES: glycosyltransferase family 2 protein [unclassified Pseudoalteromonas]MCF2901343.1 glycosyltransferase [Pseudoalteromonas sp. OFAV1]TGV19327.1 glycosyltransferase family 2 protein [Pseudoalteromonas sp. MEBiC 03607]
MNTTLSIIIPHFNSVDLLSRLLSSIPNDRGYQIIVVDDNSADFEMVKEIVSNYDSAELYINSSNNKGAGAARNIGLKKAKGDYILFADADDLFVDGAFEIVEQYFKSTFDIVFFSPTSENLNTGLVGGRHLRYSKLIDEYVDNDNEIIRYKFIVPWSKLYSRFFLEKHKIAFDEVIASNDLFFSIKSGCYANAIKVTNSTIYSVSESSSSMTKNKSLDNFNVRFNTVLKCNNFLKSQPGNSYQISFKIFLIRSLKFGPLKFFSVLLTVIKEKLSLVLG